MTTTNRARRALAAAVAATAALALVAAGCGSDSSGPGVAKAPTTTQPAQGSNNGSSNGSSKASPQAFSACMRSHGVPDFPDPDSQGRLTIRGGPGSTLNPSSSQFRAAEKACRKYAPGGGKAPSPAETARMQAQALRFSACMRAHGITHFPDPQISGGRIGLTFGKNSGINPNSPQFKAAEKACRDLLPGDGPGKTTTQGSGS